MSNSLWPYRLQNARLPCPSLSPRVCSNSCALSRWCHPIISSSVVLSSSIFPSIMVFPNDSGLWVRWPKYWSFRFIIICIYLPICSYIYLICSYTYLSQVLNSSNSTKWSLMSPFYFFFSFNWRINASQYCDGPCHTSAWMGHRHTCVPSLLNPLPTSFPPHHSLLSQSTNWVPCVTHQTRSGDLFYPYGRKLRGTKKPLDKSERGEWKSWLKAQHSEN